MFPFRSDDELVQRAFGVAKAANARVRSVEIFKSPTLARGATIDVVKTVLEPPYDEAIEEVFARALRHLTGSGAKTINKAIEPVWMPGYEAARLSFDADQGNWKLGGEVVLVVDRPKGTQWLVQIVFGKERISSFVSPSLDSEHRYARKVLSTVRVRPPDPFRLEGIK